VAGDFDVTGQGKAPVACATPPFNKGELYGDIERYARFFVALRAPQNDKEKSMQCATITNVLNYTLSFLTEAQRREESSEAFDSTFFHFYRNFVLQIPIRAQ
jgi:hypothetical protein